jgi:hypothetical protein
MATPQATPTQAAETDAQKAAQAETTASDLQKWGQTVGQQ